MKADDLLLTLELPDDAVTSKVATTVLWGEQDKHLMWRMAADSCKYVAPGKCRSHVFADAGHWPHWDNPKGVVEQWKAFIAASAAGEVGTGTTPASVASGEPAPAAATTP